MFKRMMFATALALAAGPTLAAAMLTLNDGTNSITVTDQGAGDTDTREGAIGVMWKEPDTLWTTAVSNSWTAAWS